jgi:hypothetical protein
MSVRSKTRPRTRLFGQYAWVWLLAGALLVAAAVLLFWPAP